MAIFSEQDLLDIKAFIPDAAVAHIVSVPDPNEFLIITNLILESLEPGKIHISWEIEDTTLNVSDFTFFLERAGSECGPFTGITNEGLTDTFEHDDICPPGTNKFWHIYYRIVVLNTITGKFYITNPVTFYKKPDVIGREIARRNQFLLKHFVGTPCVLYRRKHWGKRCLACWDPVLRRTTRSNCVTCFNTGYENGYWKPINIDVNFNPTQNIIEHTPWGMTEPSGTTVWMARAPLVEPMDLIHELTKNRRWIVQNKAGTEKLRTQIRQILQVEELEKSRIEFKVAPQNGALSMHGTFNIN